MGMEQIVKCGPGQPISWTAVRDLLLQHGFQVQLRMIENELAFPDELPPEAWIELRVGTAHGMVTLRRQGDLVLVVTWGNADAAMQQAWNALTWAVAEVSGGRIEAGDRTETAAEFRRRAELPPGLRIHPG